MRYLGQFVIRATDKADGKSIRYVNLQPEGGGRVALLDNLGFATSLTYPEAWLVMQSQPVKDLMAGHTLEIQTLIDLSAELASPALPTLDNLLKGIQP